VGRVVKRHRRADRRGGETGAEVILLAAGAALPPTAGRVRSRAIHDAGGIGGAKLVVLCDVRTPFERAAEVFAPQKGADGATVKRLAARLDKLAVGSTATPRGVAMTGAAGGLAAACGRRSARSSSPERPFVLDALGYDARMRRVAGVIVGEGRLDNQTLQGKAAGEAATRARQAGVPCHASSARTRWSSSGTGYSTWRR